MQVNLGVVVRIIIRRHDGDGVDAETHGVFCQIDRGVGIGRADMEHDRDFTRDAAHEALGDALALVDLHHHALAVGAQREESLDAGVDVKIGQRIGTRFIDRAVFFERRRHRDQDAFDLAVTRHDSPPNSLFLSLICLRSIMSRQAMCCAPQRISYFFAWISFMNLQSKIFDSGMYSLILNCSRALRMSVSTVFFATKPSSFSERSAYW